MKIAVEEPNDRHRTLLCVHRERPRGCRSAEKRDELASPQMIELHSVPSQGPIAGYRISEDQSGGVGAEPNGWVHFTSRSPDRLRYEECIGAKKHLVLGVLSHTG